MNPTQQHPNTNKPLSSQNSRIRPPPHIHSAQRHDTSNQNQNGKLQLNNQPGKISLRNNNTKKLYKQHTGTTEENETLSLLKQSKQLQSKQNSQQTNPQKANIQRFIGRNHKQQQDQIYSKRQQTNNNNKKQFNINRTNHSFNENASETLSSMANTSSILTAYDHKCRTTSVNYPSNTHKSKEWVNSINATGEDLSGIEQNLKGSSQSLFYQTNGRLFRYNKNLIDPKQQAFYIQYKELNGDYQQQMEAQNHRLPISSSNNPNSIYANSEPISMLTSIRQDYQSLTPFATNSSNNSRSGLTTTLNTEQKNNISTPSAQFNISSLQAPQEPPPRKTASYYVSKPISEKHPVERQPSINKSGQQQFFNHMNNNSGYIISKQGNKIQSAKDITHSVFSVGLKSPFVSHRPSEQSNARSSLTVRNLELVAGNHTDQRIKSHTKNYSTTQLHSHNLKPNNHDLVKRYPPQTLNLHQQPKFTAYPHNLTPNQQLASICQSEPLYGEITSSLSSPNNRNSYNPYHNLMQATGMNKSNEKSYILDSIQEKDEFGRLFVRANNGKSYDKAESAQSIKHLQRQKHQSRIHPKQLKTHPFNESQMIKSLDQNYSSNQSAYDQVNSSNGSYSNNQFNGAVGALSNLKYIRSPTSQADDKLHLSDKGVKDYEKYLKVGYEPFVVGNQVVNQLINQQRQKNASNQHYTLYNTSPNSTNDQNKVKCSVRTKEEHNQDNHSVNSSFKETSKSQTHSIYSYNSKTLPDKFYHVSNNQYQSTIRGKQQRNNPAEIYSSNKNFRHLLHQEDNQTDLFRKTIDSSMKPPNLVTHKYNKEEGKPLQSLGARQLRPQFHYEYEPSQSNPPVITINQTRFKSSDYHQDEKEQKRLTLDMMGLSEYSPNKQTVFSPTQKSMQPAQKSHFLPEPESQQNRQNVRQKKSIKKMLVSQSKGPQQKNQVFYNYNFKDLLKGEKEDDRPNSRTFLETITKNQITKIFCSTFKIGQNENGCDCIPKCYWIDNWIEKIHGHPSLHKESLMKNLDKNAHMLNFTSENIWKNFSNGEAVSFPDITYDNPKLSKQEIETFKQIDKDVPRTCSSHSTFKSQRYRDFLRQVLIHFYYIDPQLGYVQGMNIIAASITYHSKTVLQALQVMDFVMNVLGYKIIYLNDMKKCKQLSAKTSYLVKHYCYDMYNYVTIENEVDLEMFILGWYFSMLGTFVPLDSMHLVINKFIEKQFQGLVKVIVTYFIFIKDILMQKTDPNQIMEELSVQCMVERSQKIDWNELITVSDKLQITLEKDKF